MRPSKTAKTNDKPKIKDKTNNYYPKTNLKTYLNDMSTIMSFPQMSTTETVSMK